MTKHPGEEERASVKVPPTSPSRHTRSENTAGTLRITQNHAAPRWPCNGAVGAETWRTSHARSPTNPGVRRLPNPLRMHRAFLSPVFTE